MRGEAWLGHTGVRWNILIDAALEEVPPAGLLRDRLARLAQARQWPEPGVDVVVEGEPDVLLRRFALCEDEAGPVSVGRTPQGLVVRGHHAHVDGLGLLAVLGTLTGAQVTSSARGVTGRPHRSAAATVAGRLAEVAFRPPAPYPGTPSGPGDVLVRHTLDRAVRTAELVVAAAQAVGRPRVAVAVGVSTRGGAELVVGEHSGFLRLTDVASMDLGAVETALRDAPLQLGGSAPTALSRHAGGIIRWASRRFSSRLGSTVLVSHLGRVGSRGVGPVAFYPVAGTGSGLALGAATVGASTTITLRARGRTHSEQDLRELSAALIACLGG